MNGRMRTAALLALTVLTVVVSGAGGAVGAAPPFHLVFDGRHNENLWHEGSFTTSADFCPSGTAADVDVDDVTLTAVRRFSCSGGDAFTARIGSLRAEHGGTGTWEILGGTGALTDLRGSGTFTSVRLTGNADDPLAITFRSTWDGVAAFDVAPPVITITAASIRRLARPVGVWQVRTVFHLADAGGIASWHASVSDRRTPLVLLASKSGTVDPGAAGVSLRLRIPRGARVLRLQVDAGDGVGNRSTSVKLLRLP